MRYEPPQSPKKPQLVFQRLIPGLILGMVVLFGLVVMGNLQLVTDNLLGFRWIYLGFALVCTIFNYSLRYVKWNYYLGLIGVQNIHWSESLRLFVAGFPLLVTPGKVGEAVKGLWIHQKTGIPTGRGVSVVLAERLTDGLAVLGLCLIGVMAFPSFWPIFALALAFLLCIIIIILVRPATQAVFSWLEHRKGLTSFVREARDFYDGSYSLIQPLPTLFCFIIGLVSWLGEGLGLFFILLGFGLPLSWQLAFLAVFCMAFSTILGAVSGLPGGLGTFEVCLTGMLVFLIRVDPATAVSVTLLIRLTTLWFGIFIGVFVWTGSKDLFGLQTPHDSLIEN